MTAPLLFTPEIDWDEPLVEEREYETAIFVAHDGTETREGLRVSPNRRLSYSVGTSDLRESGLAHALVHAGQGVTCWVPYWRKAQYLPANLGIGATSVTLPNARQQGFIQGEGAMLYRDWHTAEAVTITGMTNTTLVFSATAAAWRGTSTPRDRIVPLYRGRLAPETDLAYLGRGLVSIPVTFDLGQGLGTEGTQSTGGGGSQVEPQPPCSGALITDLTSDGGVLWNFHSGSFDSEEHAFVDEMLTILVPATLADVPHVMPFHLGAYWYTDVTGLTPDVMYQVQADLVFGPWFDHRYDVGLFQPGGSMGGIMEPIDNATTSGTFYLRDIPRYDGGTTFRVAVGWSFLAFLTVSDHTAFTAASVLFSGPCL